MKVDDVLDYLNELYPDYIEDYGIYNTLYNLIEQLKDGENDASLKKNQLNKF